MPTLKISSLLLLVVSTCAFSSEVLGYPRSLSTPIQIGIYPPVQFPPDNFTVKGLRLSIAMGRSQNMYGIDLALIGNNTEQDFGGLALAGIFNWNEETATIYGAQLAGVTNINRGSAAVYGIQASLFANLSSYTDIYGVQLGIYNRARNVYGLQLGLVNVASSLHGIQIGLANFNDSGPFGVAPLINFGW